MWGRNRSLVSRTEGTQPCGRPRWGQARGHVPPCGAGTEMWKQAVLPAAPPGPIPLRTHVQPRLWARRCPQTPWVPRVMPGLSASAGATPGACACRLAPEAAAPRLGASPGCGDAAVLPAPAAAPAPAPPAADAADASGRGPGPAQPPPHLPAPRSWAGRAPPRGPRAGLSRSLGIAQLGPMLVGLGAWGGEVGAGQRVSRVSPLSWAWLCWLDAVGWTGTDRGGRCTWSLRSCSSPAGGREGGFAAGRL